LCYASLDDMCGIGGILRRDGQPIPKEWLDGIDARIAYRGPDGHGRFHDRVESGGRVIEVALVHRRLSIIDHASGGQPMISERGRDDSEGLIAVVFNGCIYNHRELRSELEEEGHDFTSDHSDTEALIHGYRQWGAEVTDHLEGMYAFALWDRENATLVLGRDWFGEKPLYVRSAIDDSDVIGFSSDALSLAKLGDPLPQGDSRAWVRLYLQLGYNWRGCTVFDGLNSGVRNIEPTIRRKIDSLMPSRPRESHSQRDFENLIEQAVARRLEADVPLGCFLSGGVDSSLIAHFARQHNPDLRTFTVKMPDPRYDESHHAERVAHHLGTDHATLEAAVDPAGDLAHLIETLGQPFGDSSILPTYWVSKAARQHVKVALSGDGGDELFIGYERFMAARHLWRHRRLLQWIPRRWLRGSHPKSWRHKIGRLGEMARDLRSCGILAMESIVNQHQIFELLGGRHGVPAAQDARPDPMQQLRRIDLMSYLPDDLLCKVDTASMAVIGGPLEVRCPFLDRDLVAAVMAAPTWQLTAGGRKGLLRTIARKHLPDDVVDRPKMGFAIPIGEWFRNDFGGMRTLLLSHLDREDAFGPIQVRQDAVARMVDEHLGGGHEHGQRLFALLTLAMFVQRVTESSERGDALSAC
jgi:asparagine synthase (glutamine-hydrolysing)